MAVETSHRDTAVSSQVDVCLLGQHLRLGSGKTGEATDDILSATVAWETTKLLT